MHTCICVMCLIRACMVSDSSYRSARGASMCQESWGHRLAGRVSRSSSADPWCSRCCRAAEVTAAERRDGRIVCLRREEISSVEEAVWAWPTAEFGCRLLYVCRCWRPSTCTHAGSHLLSLPRKHFANQTMYRPRWHRTLAGGKSRNGRIILLVANMMADFDLEVLFPVYVW